MVPLRAADLAALPPRLRPPGYDRGAVRAGIVHFSVGNFHRAHAAVYLDRCLGLSGQEGWGICGVGLIDSAGERAKAAAMVLQDGLYTLTLFPPQGEPAASVVGSIVEYLFAPADPAAVLARLRDPRIRIVSLTITEGGYNLDAIGRFRLDTPEIVHDLAHPDEPKTVFGFVVAALAQRRADGAEPFTVLSCDNLSHNGEVLKQCVLAFAMARDRALADWIAAHATFPSCMVDRITPAVGPADRARLNALNGVEDQVPVFAEDYIQWVVEDRFCAGRPALEQVGVQFTQHVDAYEQIKLRMLNATHSMLSYPGILLGHRLVHEAVGDPVILPYLRGFLDHDAIPVLTAPPGMSLVAYRDTVLARFANPAIADQLTRITSDGASKIPVFLGDTLRACLEAGRDHRRLAFLLAAFARYLGGRDDHGTGYEPLEPHLSAEDRGLALGEDPVAVLRIGNFKGLGLERSAAFVATFLDFRARLAARGTHAALDQMDRG